ncbi:mitotic spindle checkpoint protein MAD1 [Phalaenopsis equestris]|uniref:mitotic spindle checkpoint protein MAD1 n=1 Tax=Phalaenopsis equestris TaxID=78828 RepID=UPI0009E64109|nr:mitotic spindle checkpoint protein MAD1 [Phalaenopsis equestris]
MILRTPLQRKRRVSSGSEHDSPVSDRRLVPYLETSDELVCTYHCRQMVKSEFMAALSTAEKQILEYKSRLEALKNDLCNCEQERQKYRDNFYSAKQELQASKGRENALQEQLLKEITDYQERYHTHLRRYSELEILLKKEVEVRKNAELSAETAKEKASAVEKELLLVSQNNEREKNRLHLSFSHLQDESKLSLSRVNAELERMRVRADSFEKEAELLKKTLVDLKEQLNECLHEKSQLECKLSSCDSPLVTASSSESPTLVKHLKDELRKAEAELKEARQLKSSHMNKELLIEQLLEEKERREKAELELNRLQEIQVHAQTLDSELTIWKSLLNQIPDVSCYDDIPRKCAQLQKETIENMLKVGETNALLKELQINLEMANLSKEHAEKECKLEQEKAICQSLEVKRLELMLASVSEECEKLKKDVVSLSEHKSGLSSSGQTTETDLEIVIEHKEHIIGGLESNIFQLREIINRQHDEMKHLNEDLNVETKKVKALERESDRLRSEICLLESKLGQGNYSAENTKVLRMVNSLGFDNEAKRTIETLRAELRKAKAKLQAIEELTGQSDAGNVINVDMPEKLSQLKEQIAILEKREERYKAVFAEKISVFRRACCSLFGYKIVMDDQQRPNGIPMTRFTLQSIYAQRDEEKLEFDYESGNATILVNDYTSQTEIHHQVDIFIRKMNSIPAFTANLTMESFNKRTLS